MKVLILGARGMLGSMLCSIFQDARPECWDREELDITDEHTTRQHIVGLKPDIIINAAAYTDVDGAESNQSRAFAVNEGGVIAVARAAREIGATMVHYSTDYVFLGDAQEGYGEEDEPGPTVNVYGASKLAGERALLAIAPRFFLVRTAWLFGHESDNFVDTMLILARKQRTLTIVNDQYGTPTCTKDLAQATRVLIEEGNNEPGVYHLINEDVTTWYEFAVEIFKLTNLDVVAQPVSAEALLRPARRPRYSILKNTRRPRLRSWKLALADYLKN